MCLVSCPKCGSEISVPLIPEVTRLNARGDVQVRFDPQIIKHECRGTQW